MIAQDKDNGCYGFFFDQLAQFHTVYVGQGYIQ